MNKKTNKLGYGLLSLALAISFPLNASATENLTKPANTTEPTSIIEETEDTTLLDEEDIIDTEPEESQETAPTPVPAANPSAPQTLPQAESHNYISQKGKEDEKKEKPFKVIVHDENNREGRLKKESDGVRNHFTLNYGLGIEGNGLEKEYTISIFTLRDSKIESLNLKNYITDSKATSDGEKMEKETSKIENEDYKGFTIKTKIANTGSLEFDYKFEEEAEAGDYSVYYLIEMDGEKVLGKIDVNLEKTLDGYDFYMSRDEVVRDYANYNEEKVNPFAELPFTKFLLNDTEDDKKLTDFVGPEEEEDKALKITYINPTADKEKVEVIDNIEEYQIPANSLAKLEVISKEDSKDIAKASENAETPKKDKENLEDLSEYDDKEKDLIKLTSMLNKQAEGLEKLTKQEPAKASDKESAKAPQTMADLVTKELEGDFVPKSLKDSNYTEEQIKKAMAEVDRLLEEKKRSVLEINPQYDETEAEILGLSMVLREQTEKIEGLIQQALLDNELTSLEELEKTNPEKANEEYKRLAKLLKDAEKTTDKAKEKLIELDEINLVDNNTDPLFRAKKGEKAVLNLGKLTPITRIDDLTHDSPKESEKDFSKNLEKKLAKAVEKVETVTLTKDDDAKAKTENKKDPKSSDKKEDKNKKIIVVDKKEKEADKKATDKKEKENLSLPIFERYLKRVKGQK